MRHYQGRLQSGDLGEYLTQGRVLLNILPGYGTYCPQIIGR